MARASNKQSVKEAKAKVEKNQEAQVEVQVEEQVIEKHTTHAIPEVKEKKIKNIFLYNRSQRSHIVGSEELIDGHSHVRPRESTNSRWGWIDPERTVEVTPACGERLLKMFPKDFKKVAKESMED